MSVSFLVNLPIHIPVTVIKKKSGNNGQKQTVGHMPGRLAEVLYKPLMDNNVLVQCRLTGRSRSALEGVWVQDGGIEIPVKVRTRLRQLRKDLKESLQRLTPM